jgi:hypothetical protein
MYLKVRRDYLPFGCSTSFYFLAFLLSIISLLASRFTMSWNAFPIKSHAAHLSASPSLHSNIACLSRNENHMEIFFITAEGAIEACYYEDGHSWKGYQLAPAGSASLTGGIAAVSRSDENEDVFWIGQHGSVEAAYWTMTGDKWVRYALAPAWNAAEQSRVAALALHDAHMEVWWVDTVGAIWSVAWSGSWKWRDRLTEPGTASAAGSLVACSPPRQNHSQYINSPPEKDDSPSDACSENEIVSLNTTHLFWTAPNGGTQHGSKFEGSSWRFNSAWDGRSMGTSHCLCAKAESRCEGVDVYILMDDLRLVHAHGERAEHPDRQMKYTRGLPGYKWDFAREVVMTDDENNTLGKDSIVTCVSRYLGYGEVFWSAPNGAIFVLENDGKRTRQIQIARRCTINASSPLTALSRSDGQAELWGVAKDGTLLAGGVRSEASERDG